MWRRYIFKGIPTKKAVVRNFAEESENTPKTSKTGILESELNEIEKKHEYRDKMNATKTDIKESGKDIFSMMTMVFVEVAKTFIAGRDIHKAVNKEFKRVNKEEHIILIGKQGCGNVLLRNALIKSGNKESDNSNINVSKEHPSSETKSNKTSVEFGEIEIYHKLYKRKVKITSLNVEDNASLSSLAISEEYSVVFCFPVSFRFTTEDSKLLEKYLQYRQREDFNRVTVAFTFSDRKDVKDKNYIANLPKDMKDLLQKYGNNYVFISSGENSSTKNEQSVKRLLKPQYSIECLQSLQGTIFAYLSVVLLRVFKIPYL